MKPQGAKSAFCRCRNICVRDFNEEPEKALRIPHELAAQEISGECIAFSKLSPSAIAVKDQNCIRIIRRSSLSTAIECRMCKCEICILGIGAHYAAGIDLKSFSVEDFEWSPCCCVQMSIPGLPLTMRSYIVCSGSNCGIDYRSDQHCCPKADESEAFDIDDDLMFSPKKEECLVGSYVEKPLFEC